MAKLSEEQAAQFFALKAVQVWAAEAARGDDRSTFLILDDDDVAGWLALVMVVENVTVVLPMGVDDAIGVHEALGRGIDNQIIAEAMRIGKDDADGR